MDILSGVIVFRRHGHSLRSPVGYCPSLAALANFAQALQPYSNASIHKIVFTTTRYIDPPEHPQQAAATDGKKAWLQFYEKTEHYRQVIIQSPKIEIFDQVTAGMYITRTVGEEIARRYSQMTGKTYAWDKGKLWEERE